MPCPPPQVSLTELIKIKNKNHNLKHFTAFTSKCLQDNLQKRELLEYGGQQVMDKFAQMKSVYK